MLSFKKQKNGNSFGIMFTQTFVYAKPAYETGWKIKVLYYFKVAEQKKQPI